MAWPPGHAAEERKSPRADLLKHGALAAPRRRGDRRVLRRVRVRRFRRFDFRGFFGGGARGEHQNCGEPHGASVALIGRLRLLKERPEQ